MTQSEQEHVQAELDKILFNLCYGVDKEWRTSKSGDNARSIAKEALLRLLAREVLEGRLIELDLLEQAINSGRNISGYKLLRLEDLTARLDKMSKLEGKDG